jgi:phage replication O-like protein O
MSNKLHCGYTKITNKTMDALAKIRIPGQARQVLDFVFRKTYGWNKKIDIISLSQFVKGTGLSKVAVCKSINKLLKMNLITKKGNALSLFTQKGNDTEITYGFQKDYNLWRALPKKVTLPKKVIDVTQKGNLTLPKKVHTKERLTKETIQKKEKIPYGSIMGFYNEIGLPKMRQWTEPRKTHFKARWNAKYESGNSLKSNSLEFWEGFFKFVKERKFLMGENERNWTADFDWLIKEANFIKVWEGKYK